MSVSTEKYIPQIAANQRLERVGFVAWALTALFLLVWIGLIAAAPLLQANGFLQSSNAIYTFFSYVCHQMSERSFHLHGEALAVCARCFGVYAGLTAGVLAFPLVRSINDTIPPARFWLLLAPVPTAIDWALGYFGIWENTHLSRFQTALILGIGCAFFLVPGIVEISRYVSDKRSKQTKKVENTVPALPESSAPSDYSRPDLRI